MQIDKNIPVPLKASEIAQQMEKGDSVLCPDHREALRLRDALRWRGIEYKTRQCDGGVRVWRLS